MGTSTDHSGQDQKHTCAGQQLFSRSNGNMSREPSKLDMPVRSRSPAPPKNPYTATFFALRGPSVGRETWITGPQRGRKYHTATAGPAQQLGPQNGPQQPPEHSDPPDCPPPLRARRRVTGCAAAAFAHLIETRSFSRVECVQDRKS